MGLATGYTVTLVTIIAGLWLTPFTLRFLSREEYAIFTLAGDLLMWLGLLDFGISSGLNVQAAQLTGRPDSERLNRLASTAFFTQNIICLIILVVGTIAALFFPVFFEINPVLSHQAIQVTLLMVVGVAINIFVQTFASLLIANQQVHIDNLIRLVLVVTRTGLTVILLLSGWKMLSLAIANLTAIIITAILAVIRVRHLLPDLQIKKKWFSWDVLKSTGNLGIWFSLGGLAGIAIVHLDRIVTAKIISIELVTTLSLTGRLYTLFGGLLQQLTNTARPMLGQLLGAGKLEQAFLRYRQLFTVSTGMTIIVAAGILSLNGDFISLWVGKLNYGGFWLDCALALNMIVHAWVLPNRAILSSNMIVRPQALTRLLEGLFNLALSIFLGLKFGIIGIVLSTAIAGILTSNWYLPLLTFRMFHRNYKEFLRGDGLRLVILGVLLFSMILVMRTLFSESTNMISTVISSLTVVLSGLALFWFLVLESAFRQFTIKQVQSLVGLHSE